MIPFELEVLDATPEPFAATPTLAFRMRMKAPERTGRIESIALRAQIRIEPQRRQYEDGDREPLRELFGAAEMWSESLRPFLWTHATTTVRGFSESTEFDLPVPCTYDFDVAAAKYLHALQDGEVPLILLFSGSVFRNGPQGLQVVPMSWDCEARHRLPVRVWREMMDRYYPNSGWLRLRRDVLDELLRLKAERAVATFDDLLQSLFDDIGKSPRAGAVR